LILVGLGSAIVLWAMALHFARTREGWDWERTPKYLLRQGPYAFTRNPMYLAELVLWLGWALFFGSLAVFLGTLLAWVIFSIVVRREEQAMEARFGEAYRAYQSRVPRWLGRPRC
jgi:protein-S-isoprenylcysteine O-methyltransferase Ste14